MIKHVAKEQLRVPAKVDYLKELRDFVTKVGKKHGFSDRVINAFKLSIDEAATNIIKHAYRDWDGDITLKIIIKSKSMTVVLIDQGKYFDPRQVNDPDLQRYVAIGKKGGLGIFMMRRLLDGIDYRKTELGNELWLTKNKEDVRETNKFSIKSFHLSLKMRYWLISAGVYTVLVFLVFTALFIQRKLQIEPEFVNKAQTQADAVATDISIRWNKLPIDVLEELRANGSNEYEVMVSAVDPLRSRMNSGFEMPVHDVVIVLNDYKILTSMIALVDSQKIVFNTDFALPENAQSRRDNVYVYNTESVKVLDYVQPILDEELNTLGHVHYQIDYKTIEAALRGDLFRLGRLGLLIWLVGSASLLVLIFLVMNPFKRLQEWVKTLGQTGDIDEVDIDETTEVGEIAQAFSDITKQLRESQTNLAEQERLKKEMQLAQQIQHTLIPQKFPDIEGYDIQCYYESAVEVGGDFYDFVEVDKDTLGVAVADVSGKGVPGSLMMATIRTALRTEARGMKDAAEVLTKVNDLVVNDMRKGMFVTIFYVIIDSKRRRLNFASAGHNPMILYRASTNNTYYLNPKGFPIGIRLPEEDLFKRTIQSDTIALTKDDILILNTDGITEAMNRKRELFGDERFLDVIRNNGIKSATEFIDTLKNTLNTFTEGNQQSDDITLVAIKEKKSVNEVEYERAKKVFAMLAEGTSIKEACETAGITTYSYNTKYRKKFEKEGVDSIEIEADETEVRHLSIEEKSKIYDVILKHPEYGAKKIAEVLNTEEYGFADIKYAKIYEELKQRRLNTKELREQFINRGGKLRKRIKPPGNPILTMDGDVIHQKPKFRDEEDRPQVEEKSVEKPVEPEEPKVAEKPAEFQDAPATNVYALPKDKALTEPLEDLLDSRKAIEEEEEKHKLLSEAVNYLKSAKKDKTKATPRKEVDNEMNEPKSPESEFSQNGFDNESAGREPYTNLNETELDDNFFQSHFTEFVDSAATDNEGYEPAVPDENDDEFSEFTREQDELVDMFNKEEQDILDDTKDFEFADNDETGDASAITELLATDDKAALPQEFDEFDDLFNDFIENGAEKAMQQTAVDEVDEFAKQNIDFEQEAQTQQAELQDKQTLNVELPSSEDYPPLIGEFAEPEDEIIEEPASETKQEDDKDIQIESEILGGFVEGDFSALDEPAAETTTVEETLPKQNEEDKSDDWFTLEEKDVNLDELEILSNVYSRQYPDVDERVFQEQLEDFEKSIGDEEELLDLDEWYRKGQEEKEKTVQTDEKQHSEAWLDFETDSEDTEFIENPESFDDSEAIKTVDDLQLDDDFDFSGSLEWSDPADDSTVFYPQNGKSHHNDEPEYDEHDLSDLLRSEPEYDHPFEEFLEIEEEDGLINEYGETDFDLVDDSYEFTGDINQTDSEELLADDFLNDEELDRDFQEYSHQEEQEFLDLLEDDDEEDFEPAFPEEQPQRTVSQDDDITSGLDLGSFLEKAVEYYKNSNYDRAIKLFKAIVDITPEDYRIHNLLGDAYFRNKNFQQAAHEYNMVMKFDPTNIKACENLGVVYANQHDLTKAVKQWELLLSLAPERKDIAKNIAWAKQLIH